MHNFRCENYWQHRYTFKKALAQLRILTIIIMDMPTQQNRTEQKKTKKKTPQCEDTERKQKHHKQKLFSMSI